MDAKMHTEKPRWQQHKNATSCFEQALEVTPYKTAALGPPTSHLNTHPS